MAPERVIVCPTLFRLAVLFLAVFSGALAHASESAESDQIENQKRSAATSVSDGSPESGPDAQGESPSAADPFALETVLVTGTRVKIKGGLVVAPVEVFTGEMLRRQGFTTLTDFSRSLTLNADALVEYAHINFDGSPSFNLRGLGVDATLTLVNGRRVGTVKSLFDINTIPVSLIDRIEILKDGASAIYGADAVAGVVNVILKKDFLGGELDLLYQDTSEGDLSESQASVSFGKFIGSGSVWGFASFYRANSVEFKDREGFDTEDRRELGGSDNRFPASRPGNYLVHNPDGTIDYTWDPACATAPPPVGVSMQSLFPFFNNLSDRFCVYDRAKDRTLIGPAERYSLYAGFDFPVADHTLFGEVFVSRRDRSYRLPPGLPTTGTGLFGFPFVPADHPNNPFARPVTILYAVADMGRPGSDNRYEFDQLLLGLKGEVGNWSYESTVQASRDGLDRRFPNRILGDEFQAALEGRGGPDGNAYYDPFGGAQNDPAVIAGFTATPEWFRDTEQLVVEGFLTRDVFEWRYGVGALAAGLEHRNLEQNNTLLVPGAVIGFGSAATVFDREVNSLFAEFTLPVYRDFDVQLAARHEQFSDFGSHTSPKVGFRWQVTEDLILRGSFSNAFKAPDGSELDTDAQFTRTVGYIDPIRCSDPLLQSTAECTNGTVAIENFSGNAELDPEVADSVVLGLVYVPPFLRPLAIDVDYWKFVYDDRIDELSASGVATFFPEDPRYVTRLPPDDDDIAAGRPGRVSELFLTYINFEKLEAEGIDGAVKWEREFRKLGKLEVDARATYYKRYEFKDSLSLNPGNRVGRGNPFGLPRWRANLLATWSKDDHAVTLNTRYVHSFVNDSFFEPVAFGSWTTVDLQYQLTLPQLGSGTVRIGCIDCFDKGVPIKNEPARLASVFSFYDPRGRQLAVSYSLRF